MWTAEELKIMDKAEKLFDCQLQKPILKTRFLNSLMITIHEASGHDYPLIHRIAHQTWPHTFGNILSQEQISYMLEWMYSISSLQEQVEKQGHKFLLAKDEEAYLGYASYELNYKGQLVTKIHKLYVLPAAQGKGIGRALIHKVQEIAMQHANEALSLNVNRDNPAVQFYQNMGFDITGEENISIGQGFLMEDYIMRKEIG